MPNRKTGSTITMRVMCAISFIIYIFLFITGYQASTLIYVQHILSDGQTHFDPLIGGSILTIVLMIIQWVTVRYTRLQNTFHVLTYIPSMLVLILLTDVDVIPAEKIGELGGLSTGVFSWFVPFIAIGFIFFVIFAKQWIPAPQRGKVNGFVSFDVLFTILMMVVMMGGVTYLANGDRAFHRQMKAEKAFVSGDTETLVHINQSDADNPTADSYASADTTLTLYRAIALSKRGSLADSLFYMPVTGNTASITTFEGVRLNNMPLNALQKEVKGILNNKKLSVDYQLIGMLLSRDIDGFAHALPLYYHINDSLPQHYKEALILYQHVRSNPLITYSNDVMEADYQGVQDIYHKFNSADQRRHEIKRQYRHTYWAYYLFSE